MEDNTLIELEAILSFIGIEFIDYKGKRTSNGHKTATTVQEIISFFGKEIQTTGMSIDRIEKSKMFDIKNDWNWIMFVVEKIESLGYDFNILTPTVIDVNKDGKTFIYLDGNRSKIEAVYKAIIEFIKWYNKNESNEHRE